MRVPLSIKSLWKMGGSAREGRKPFSRKAVFEYEYV